MLTFHLPLSLLIIHFIADFVCQSDWMALNKSKSNEALTIHVALYTLCFLPFSLGFLAITFVTHWITDYLTSRLTSKLWFLELKPLSQFPWCKVCADYDYAAIDKGSRHWFFVAIGFDQLIHYVTLALTWHFIYS